MFLIATPAAAFASALAATPATAFASALAVTPAAALASALAVTPAAALASVLAAAPTAALAVTPTATFTVKPRLQLSHIHSAGATIVGAWRNDRLARRVAGPLAADPTITALVAEPATQLL